MTSADLSDRAYALASNILRMESELSALRAHMRTIAAEVGLPGDADPAEVALQVLTRLRAEVGESDDQGGGLAHPGLLGGEDDPCAIRLGGAT
jgi:hypothetical protein